MSGLFSSLSASTGALGAQSRAVDIAGRNLANVSNPNYARQRVIFGDRGTVMTTSGPESMGLEAMGVQQMRDALLDKQVVRESALTAYYQQQQSSFQRAQAGLGQDVASAGTASSATNSTGDSGISAGIDDFFNAFQSFASNPTDNGERQSLIQTTGILTDRIQLADNRLAQVQSDLNAQVTSDVSDVNAQLQTIASLNTQIAQMEVNNPGSAVDLRDERQAALESLGKNFQFDATEASDGQVQITTKDGSGTPVIVVNQGTVTGPISFDTSTTPPTLKAGSTVIAQTSGAMQGALDASSGPIQTLRTQLDQLANQLVTSVNAIYNPTSTPGADFFDPTGTTAGTLALQSGLTAATVKSGSSAAAGDNSIAVAIAQLANKKFSTTGSPADVIDGTFTTFFSGSVSGIGQALAGANTRVKDQSNIEQLVRSQRDSVSGVSLDEEMSNLMKYQRAFQASSRVFMTIDNLLDVVVNQMGR